MSEDLLERLIKDYLGLGFEGVSLAWQGGEPTLMGLDFYKRAVEFEGKYGFDGQVVSNAFQTNGVLLDSEWAKFFMEYHFLVGISLDGPRELHDHYRKDRAGKGTFDRVMEGIGNCSAHNVEYNILCLLNDVNVRKPDEVFDFYMEQGFEFLQFVPCVERDVRTGEVLDFCISSQEYGDFMCRVFDRWQEYGVDKVSIRMFDSIMHYLISGRHTNCTFGRRCDDYIVVEHNGDVFCCDFFVEEDYKLGNILESGIGEIYSSNKKGEFARAKNRLSNKCFVCRYSQLCRGGCLKDRRTQAGGFKRCSYFCEAYKQFFDHSMGKFQEYAANYSAANRGR